MVQASKHNRLAYFLFTTHLFSIKFYCPPRKRNRVYDPGFIKIFPLSQSSLATEDQRYHSAKHSVRVLAVVCSNILIQSILYVEYSYDVISFEHFSRTHFKVHHSLFTCFNPNFVVNSKFVSKTICTYHILIQTKYFSKYLCSTQNKIVTRLKELEFKMKILIYFHYMPFT